jgi:competence protein ComEA
MQRLALALVLLAALSTAPLRTWLERPSRRPVCAVPQGRGEGVRGWIGCAGDAGEPRPLRQDERMALGLPVDPNRAGVRELALVPGLTAGLARAVVEERRRAGPFATVEDLGRVRGIGPKRLARARPHLSVHPP